MSYIICYKGSDSESSFRGSASWTIHNEEDFNLNSCWLVWSASFGRAGKESQQAYWWCLERRNIVGWGGVGTFNGIMADELVGVFWEGRQGNRQAYWRRSGRHMFWNSRAATIKYDKGLGPMKQDLPVYIRFLTIKSTDVGLRPAWAINATR